FEFLSDLPESRCWKYSRSAGVPWPRSGENRTNHVHEPLFEGCRASPRSCLRDEQEHGGSTLFRHHALSLERGANQWGLLSKPWLRGDRQPDLNRRGNYTGLCQLGHHWFRSASNTQLESRLCERAGHWLLRLQRQPGAS